MQKTFDEFITESEELLDEMSKKQVCVKQHGKTKYKVTHSTHHSCKKGDILSDTEYDELHQAHQAGDLKLKNESVEELEEMEDDLSHDERRKIIGGLEQRMLMTNGHGKRAKIQNAIDYHKGKLPKDGDSKKKYLGRKSFRTGR